MPNAAPKLDTSSENDPQIPLRELRSTIERVVDNVGRVILGKEMEVRQAVGCWLAGGHALFQDVPGTGKTMLARSLAASVALPSARVQFTPDLLPSDILGTTVYQKEKGSFAFLPGPIFTSVLLADELNRATPRTQSALLEAMAEGQCTAEKRTFKLPPTFFVIATQNPIEQQGTFPLPEAQLDRFMMRLSLGYPGADSEMNLVRGQLLAHPIDSLGAVVEEEEWTAVRQWVRHVQVSDRVLRYAMDLVESTRRHPQLQLGASPRATIALIRSGQAFSLMYGESFVKPDFLKWIAPAVLAHRLILSTRARLERLTPEQILEECIARVDVPIK
jgi:MoxR-like ATPase